MKRQYLHYTVFVLIASLLAACQGDRGKTELEVAVENNDVERVQQLISEGVEVDVKTTKTSSEQIRQYLYERAVYQGYDSVLVLLLKAGADITKYTKITRDDGFTPLSNTSFSGDTSIVKTLLSYGADPNVQDDFSGWTPLHGAILKEHSTVAKILLRNGADLNITDRMGYKPIDHAIYKHNVELTWLMMLYGADIFSKDGGYETPMQRIKSTWTKQEIQELISEMNED